MQLPFSKSVFYLKKFIETKTYWFFLPARQPEAAAKFLGDIVSSMWSNSIPVNRLSR